jgi:hypothetical protein
MELKDFLNNVATGNAIEAKNVLNDYLSAKAFAALEDKKVEIAQSLFNANGDENMEVQVQDTENTEQTEE